MSLLEKDQKLEKIRQQIYETEEDIKEIQRQLLKKRSEISQNQVKSVRKTNKPQTVEPDFSEEAFEGISEDHYQLLGRLKQKVSVTRNKVDKLHNANAMLQNDIVHQNEEIAKLENDTVDVKSRLFEISQNNRKQKENESFQKGRKRELKTATRDYRRAAKDAEILITGLEIKSSIPNEDRIDLKPQMENLVFLENSIRYTNKEIDDLKEEINLLNIEMEKPIVPDNDEDKEILPYYQIADDLEPDIKRLTDECNQKEKELNLLRQEVMKKHTQSLMIEQKFERIKSLVEENISFEGKIPNATTDELLKKLDIALSKSKGDKEYLQSQLNEKISSNHAKESLIKKKIRKIEMMKVMNEREIAKIKSSIKEQRDKSFDAEMELLSKIKEIQRKENLEKERKKKK
ncbi:hypothetical protein M9Y10_034086 [Tritrichomonas musculus]|uniref:DUF4201 domain-containing protein n=1 Tax=Tritrichomonas musculus TaxID=1915356 RepID=A0ABR2KH29_9EUKA